MKIVVLEDRLDDVIKVYSGINSRYDEGIYVHLVVHEDLMKPAAFVETLGLVRERLNGLGFVDDRVNLGYEEVARDADVYFVDGLDRRYDDIVTRTRIPKDRVYIVSGNADIATQAKALGYKTLDKSSVAVFRTVRGLLQRPTERVAVQG